MSSRIAELGHHCPFLNRADARCSDHFSLNHLGEAFEHCFDDYLACPVYKELLEERQQRRAAAAADWSAGHGGLWSASGRENPGDSDDSVRGQRAGCSAVVSGAAPLTQLTIADRRL